LLALALLAQDRPPATDEIARAYQSKVLDTGSRILFWERRNTTFRVRKIRGWDIRFKLLDIERSGALVKQRYQGTAKAGGVCHEYGVVQVSQTGPPPHHIKPDVQVAHLGRVPCK
jgi:hypothetical protein